VRSCSAANAASAFTRTSLSLSRASARARAVASDEYPDLIRNEFRGWPATVVTFAAELPRIYIARRARHGKYVKQIIKATRPLVRNDPARPVASSSSSTPLDYSLKRPLYIQPGGRSLMAERSVIKLLITNSREKNSQEFARRPRYSLSLLLVARARRWIKPLPPRAVTLDLVTDRADRDIASAMSRLGRVSRRLC